MADRAHRAAICSSHRLYAARIGQESLSPISAFARTSSFSAACSVSRVPNATCKSLNCSRAPGWRRSPIARRRNCPAACGRSSGCAAALIHDPDLLILDEPTTGVDPLSRRQFWELIDRMRARRQGMSVLVATAYMEEAERFDWLAAMNAGKVLATGSPAELKAGAAPRPSRRHSLRCFRKSERAVIKRSKYRRAASFDVAPVIVARDLTCRFGDFTAVDRVSFTIERGEIFGFLGSNGCGKTTTMKMLTGLLPPSEGEALLFGEPLKAGDMSSRYRVGYMSQSFSLYTELTVRQNLDLHAHLFHLPSRKAKARIAELVGRFGLEDYLDQRAVGSAVGNSPAALAGGRHRPRARDCSSWTSRPRASIRWRATGSGRR